ncbi:MAG: DUF6876 family protein [Betaproteobacteria bacterium]|jgi:hypothetical protein
MQTQENQSARLKADLCAFIGTEQWHRHALNRHMLVTDGVKYFAETAGCYWFLDIVATEIFRIQATHPFMVIDLEVNDTKAIIRVSDGNDAALFNRHIHYTDAPDGLWRFYLTDNVLLLPGEY